MIRPTPRAHNLKRVTRCVHRFQGLFGRAARLDPRTAKVSARAKADERKLINPDTADLGGILRYGVGFKQDAPEPIRCYADGVLDPCLGLLPLRFQVVSGRGHKFQGNHSLTSTVRQP